MSKCCSSISSFQAPSLPCIRTPLNYRSPCSDLLNASVQGILTAANPGGSTADEILNEIMSVCDVTTLPESDLNMVLNMGAKRGVLKRTLRDGQLAFFVNGGMALANPRNSPYTRCLCEFYKDRGQRNTPMPVHVPDRSPCPIPVSTNGISDVRPVPVPCSTCPGGCFSNPY
jgi:hypothetical protein